MSPSGPNVPLISDSLIGTNSYKLEISNIRGHPRLRAQTCWDSQEWDLRWEMTRGLVDRGNVCFFSCIITLIKHV
jgi:hypothetical protein